MKPKPSDVQFAEALKGIVRMGIIGKTDKNGKVSLYKADHSMMSEKRKAEIVRWANS